MAALSIELKETVVYQIMNKPTLAICVGMQMLLESSEENNGVQGLNILDGKITKLPSSQEIKVPHMGWNNVNFLHDHFLTKGIEDSSFFYFVHSYYASAESEEDISSTTTYDIDFTSSVIKDNIFACQFHPEKSSNYGLQLISNFITWSESLK